MTQPSGIQPNLFPQAFSLELPDVVQTNHHAPHLSSRYGHINSADVLNALKLEGYAVTTVGTPKSKSIFGKHVMHLEHQQARGSGFTPQIVIVNSHDGSTAYRLHIALLEHNTGQTLIVGSEWGRLRVMHTKKVVLEVVNATKMLAAESPKLAAVVEAMKNRMLSLEYQRWYAELALRARFSDDKRPISEDELLFSSGESLCPRSVWDTFQRCQKRLIAGGLKGKTPKGKPTTTRLISSPMRKVAICTTLWMLAERLASLN